MADEEESSFAAMAKFAAAQMRETIEGDEQRYGQQTFVRSREGQRMMSLILGWATGAFEVTGAFMAGSAISAMAKALGAVDSGDVFACLDQLVVDEWLVEVSSPRSKGQRRVFVAGRKGPQG